MKVLVFGAGAIGSLVGGMLHGPHEVTLVARRAHVEAIRRSGLRITGIRQRTVPLAAVTELAPGTAADIVLLTTKAYDTAAAIEALGPNLEGSPILCSLQNGVGNYEALQAAFPTRPVLGATTTMGALLEGPGVVRYAGIGDTLVGGAPKDLGTAATLARALRDAGFNALGVPDIRGPLWQKAIVNAAINPLSALEGVPNGELLARPDLRERMERVATECAAIARAIKVALPEKDTFAVVLRVAERTADNRNSMLQSLDRGRRTEIDAIVGAFLRAAQRVGLEAPESAKLYEAVRAREKELKVA